jgi:hypothetical protein
MTGRKQTRVILKKKKETGSWAWWFISVISAPGRPGR